MIKLVIKLEFLTVGREHEYDLDVASYKFEKQSLEEE